MSTKVEQITNVVTYSYESVCDLLAKIFKKSVVYVEDYDWDYDLSYDQTFYDDLMRAVKNSFNDADELPELQSVAINGGFVLFDAKESAEQYYETLDNAGLYCYIVHHD